MGCLKAHDCCYCHLCPDGELKRRKKSKVALIRSKTVKTNQDSTEDSKDADDEVQLAKIVDRGSAVSGLCRITVKNTFIHIEPDDCEDLDGATSYGDVVSPAGLVFSCRAQLAHRAAVAAVSTLLVA